MLYSSKEIATLSFQGARLEMQRLAAIPGYAVPVTYVEQVALRLVETASTPVALMTAIEASRSWMSGRIVGCFPGQFQEQFWSAVHAKPFKPVARQWSFAG